MLRFRLHPTPSGFFFGVAVIALWALLWVWFLYSLGAGNHLPGQRETASAANRIAPAEGPDRWASLATSASPTA